MKRRFEIEKVDEELRLVSGYAYVCKLHGEVVIDHSGEFVDDVREMQKAAHGFVSDSREGNVMHEGPDRGEIVDSVFFTQDMNELLQKQDGREGWFITYRVDCDETWGLIKEKKLRAFSIEGTSERESVHA